MQCVISANRLTTTFFPLLLFLIFYSFSRGESLKRDDESRGRWGGEGPVQEEVDLSGGGGVCGSTSRLRPHLSASKVAEAAQSRSILPIPSVCLTSPLPPSSFLLLLPFTTWRSKQPRLLFLLLLVLLLSLAVLAFPPPPPPHAFSQSPLLLPCLFYHQSCHRVGPKSRHVRCKRSRQVCQAWRKKTCTKMKKRRFCSSFA